MWRAVGGRRLQARRVRAARTSKEKLRDGPKDRKATRWRLVQSPNHRRRELVEEGVKRGREVGRRRAGSAWNVGLHLGGWEGDDDRLLGARRGRVSGLSLLRAGLQWVG